MIKAVKDSKTKNNWAIEVDEKHLIEVAQKINIRQKSFFKNKNGLYCSLITDKQFVSLLTNSPKQVILKKLTGDNKPDIESYISEKLTYEYNSKWIELNDQINDLKENAQVEISDLYVKFANDKIKESYDISERDIKYHFERSESISELENKLKKFEKDNKYINAEIVVNSITQYLQFKFGNDIQVSKEEIINNIDDLTKIERAHFKLNGYYLSNSIITKLQEQYKTQSKYGELINVLGTTNMHASLKKEYLSQVFINNVSEGTALFLLFTNKFNNINDVRKIIEENIIESGFTEFELLLVDRYSQVDNASKQSLHARINNIDDLEGKLSYIESVRNQNESKEFTEVERKLLMEVYQINDEDIDSIEQNLILSSYRPSVASVERILGQLKIGKPKYTKLEKGLIKHVANVTDEESKMLFNELDNVYEINNIIELAKSYDKKNEKSLINSEVKKLYIEQGTYTQEEIDLIQEQLIFQRVEATCDEIDHTAKKLHIEESNVMKKISKILSDERSALESKTVNERISELLSENEQLFNTNENLKDELKSYKQKSELIIEMNEIINKKNQVEDELKCLNIEMKSKEANVLKDIANRLSIKFEIDDTKNFDELLTQIVNQNKKSEPIYISKKKFGIKNNQFKSNKFLSNLEEQEKVEVFTKLTNEQLKLIGEENFDEYVQVIK